MSDGGNWHPGSADPRYDPYAEQQPPPRYGRPPAPRQGGPAQGRGQGQGYGQDEDYDYGYGPERGQDPGRHGGGGYGGQPGYGRQAPQRPVPPQGRPPASDPRRSPYGPAQPEGRRADDVWTAESPGVADPAGPRERAVPDPRSGGRRSGGAGRGPGRQTSAATGPGGAEGAVDGPGHVNADIDLDEIDPDGKARRAWDKQRAAAGRPASRARKATKWGAIGMCLVLLAAGGFVVYVYETTVGSIKHSALLPSGMTQTPLPADKYGNTPLNILLIGSDTRSTAADCNLGGDCTVGGNNAGANADSEMILHVSAERTNATILSIPRDTMAYLPDCTQDKSGTTSLTGNYSTYQVNSALQYGPACQVAADEYMTGITITGYIEFDFSGIITMSNALGGVPVCVTKPVHDVFTHSGSGLTLPAGFSTIKGEQALEFLRTRDSFFDGSDLGREMATHYFLSQLIQTLRKNSSMNFGNIGTLITIGQAAAQSTTVSDNFAGLSSLESLMESLSKVPTSSITMMTMPWDQDPQNQARVVVDPSAKAVFKAIQNDTSFTSNSSDSGATTSPSASSAAGADSLGLAQSFDDVQKSQVPVNVYNADNVPGRASTIVQALKSDGFSDTVSAGNAHIVSSSQVLYDPNEVTRDDALAVASALNIPSSEVQSTTQRRGVSVFIGTDFESGTTLGGGSGSAGSGGSSTTATPSVNTSGAATAPPSSRESFASGSANQCIPVKSGTLQMASINDVQK